MCIRDSPESMDLGQTFEDGGITRNSTLQPQFFLGGTVPSEDPNNPNQDTSIKIPMYHLLDLALHKISVRIY